MDPDTILEVAMKIKNSSRRDKDKFYGQKYKTFKENYPVLFNICCDPSSDISKLEFLIAMLKNVKENKMTTHVASANVGQKLFDEYIKPNIDMSKENQENQS